MTADRWLLAIGIVAPIIFGVIAYAATALLNDKIAKRIDPIEEIIQQIHISLSQRNGGSSVRDQFAFVREDIATLSGQFAQHITEHGKTPVTIKRTRKTP